MFLYTDFRLKIYIRKKPKEGLCLSASGDLSWEKLYDFVYEENILSGRIKVKSSTLISRFKSFHIIIIIAIITK